MLKTFTSHGSLKFGLLVNAGDMSHECVFTGSGSQWAFYQANAKWRKKRYVHSRTETQPVRQKLVASTI